MAPSAPGRPIALVGPHPPYRGGIAHFTESATRALIEADRFVEPVSFRRQYPSILFPGSSQRTTDAKPGEGSNEWIDSLRPTTWRQTGRRIVERNASCAVFMYWMPFFAPAYSSIASRAGSAGIPSIAVVHNALPHERHIADAWLTRRFLARCKSAMVLSGSVAEDVRYLAPTLRVVEQTHPVYDRFGSERDQGTSRDELGIDRSAHVLLFFGNVRAYKGLDVLLKAMPDVVARHPNVLLVVAGEFYEDAHRYRRIVDESNVHESVRFEDRYIPDAEVGAFFSASDVVVQPYRSATQSGVVRTAFQFGVPVIATNVGGLGNDVGDGGIVVPPDDPAELGRAVATYLDGERRPELIENVRRIRQRASWRSFADALIEEIDRSGNGGT